MGWSERVGGEVKRSGRDGITRWVINEWKRKQEGRD